MFKLSMLVCVCNYIYGMKFCITTLIIYMKKILGSDWL